MQAEVVYQKKWKSREAPGIKIWINSVEEIRKMELLTSLINWRLEKHRDIGSKWENYKQSEEFKISME